MRITGLTIAILAMISTAAPSPAGDGAPAGVRNCTWCHGTSGHGYANAPELAGQRHQYIENQLLDFTGQSIFTTVYVGCSGKSKRTDSS